MATRFYFSGAAAAVSPAYSSGWSYSLYVDTKKMVTTKDSSAMTSVERGDGVNRAANETVLVRQFVSDPMNSGQEFNTGVTVKGQVRCMESNADDNLNRQPIAVRIVSEDGATVRAVLLAVGHLAADSSEWSAATYINQKLADGDALTTTYITTKGDRLVVEIGGQVSSSGGTSVTARMLLGCDSATDLPEDETSTSDYNPWIEFSNTITFYTFARRWLWFSGWEFMPLTSGVAYAAWPNFSQQIDCGQDLWGKNSSFAMGYPIFDPDSSDGETGKGYVSPNPSVYGESEQWDAAADYSARTQRFLFHTMRDKTIEFNSAPSLTDIYALWECGTILNDAGNHLGVGLYIAQVGPPVKVSYCVIEFRAGAYYQMLGVGGSQFELPMASFHHIVLAQDTTPSGSPAKIGIRLYVDGVQEWSSVGSESLIGADQLCYVPACVRTLYVGGKSSDKQLSGHRDDFGCAEGDHWDDFPPIDTRVHYYQPNADGTVEWTKSPHFYHFDNVDGLNDSESYAAGDYIASPAETAKIETFGFPDVAGGSVEGVRILNSAWVAFASNAYKIYAKTGGSYYNLGYPGSGWQFSGYNIYRTFGKHLRLTPEGTDWSNSLFNSLMAGMITEGTTSYQCPVMGVMAIGSGLLAPAANGAPYVPPVTGIKMAWIS